LTHSRILGGFAATAAPHWLGLIGAGEISIRSLRALESPPARTPAFVAAGPASFSVRQAGKRYKHLFVYSRDRRGA
jgi:hypothetical protein